jgi:hypothetical protein
MAKPRPSRAKIKPMFIHFGIGKIRWRDTYKVFNFHAWRKENPGKQLTLQDVFEGR